MRYQIFKTKEGGLPEFTAPVVLVGFRYCSLVIS